LRLVALASFMLAERTAALPPIFITLGGPQAHDHFGEDAAAQQPHAHLAEIVTVHPGARSERLAGSLGIDIVLDDKAPKTLVSCTGCGKTRFSEG